VNPETAAGLALLSAMITPAVLISACALLVLSTSARLSRVVDRVRHLSRALDPAEDGSPAPEDDRRRRVEQLIALQAGRGTLIQHALTAFYVALSMFVGTTLGIVVAASAPRAALLPPVLGVAGTLAMLYGCVLLIRETRLALRSVNLEMQWATRGRGRPSLG
jgi:hypothetical protein